jgi:hypothetical protein
MSESDGVDIATRDEADKPQWRSVETIDWLALWKWFGGDQPSANHPRDWLGDHIDEWAEPPFRVALALKVHPNTPSWTLERARHELTAAIQQGVIYQGAQDVVWPLEVVEDA